MKGINPLRLGNNPIKISEGEIFDYFKKKFLESMISFF